jgi:SpoIID/LytB domain protein
LRQTKFIGLRRACAGLLAMLLAATGIATVSSVGSPVPASAQTSFTFTGGGWGHGVGMSQYGAKGRAEAGQSAAQILGASYPGTAVTTVNFPLAIRVLLTSGATSGLPVEVQQVGTVYNGVQPLAPGNIVLNPGTYLDLNNAIVRLPTLGNRYKDGRLSVTAAGEVVVTVEMQRYLYGLAEMPSSWSLEALKAQAIAGRTYALRRLQTPRSANYDILSTVSDQVYAGYEKEAAASGSRWVAAVDQTYGQMVTYNGAAAETYYASSHGGFVETAGYSGFFGTDKPYLQAGVDPFEAGSGNPNFRWSRTYSGADLAQYLRSFNGVDVGTVTGIDVSGNFGASGRIDRATVSITGTTRSYSMNGYDFRRMVNASNASLDRQLLSTLIFFKPVGGFDVVSQVPDGIRVQGWSAVQGSSSNAFTHVYVNGQFAASIHATGARPDVAAAVPGIGPNSGFDGVVAARAAQNTVCAYAVSPSGNANAFLGCKAINVAVDPVGSVDVASRSPEGVRVAGWALDPNSSQPIEVHVYVNGQLRAGTVANLGRGDIAAAFPGYGAAHGYDVIVPVSDALSNVCVYAINVGPGGNRLLGCRTVGSPVDPFGSLDVVNATSTGMNVGGWAIDPDTRDPIPVHVYVDGALAAGVAANVSRPDVANAFPSYGPNHGFGGSIATTAGPHQVCAYGINAGPGSNQLLGCRNVNVPGDPFGSLDVAVRTLDGRIAVSGWAIDPTIDSGSIYVHVYVDGALRTGVLANGWRSDIAAAYPQYGPVHGYNVIVDGGQRVCVYAINVGIGSNRQLGCRTV